MTNDIVSIRPQTALWQTESPRLTRLAARCATWGIFAGVAAPFLNGVVGASPLLWVLGGAGMTIGGLGAATLAIDFLRRRNVRLTWKLGGLLALPFGASLVVIGSWSLIVFPRAIYPGLGWPSWLTSGAFAVAAVLGFVLAVVFGLDLARFVFRGDESEV